MEIILFLIISITVLYLLLEYYRYDFWNKFKKYSIQQKKVYQILVPKDNVYGYKTYARFLSTIHNLVNAKDLKNSPNFSFEIYASTQFIRFYMICNFELSDFIAGQIYTEFPDVQIKEVDDYLVKIYKSSEFVEFELQKDFAFPLNANKQIGDTSIGSIIAAMTNLDDGDSAYLQVVIKPTVHDKPINDAASADETSKIMNPLFTTQIRAVVSTRSKESSKKIMNDVKNTFKQFSNPQGNSLNPVDLTKKFYLIGKLNFIPSVFQHRTISIDPLFVLSNRYINLKNKTILSADEVASIFYFPNESITNPNVEWLKSRKIPYPLNIPLYDSALKQENPRIFATTDYRDIHKIFGIKKLDRRRHMYLLGKTGTGKSTLLKNLILGDIYQGEGVGVLDPHGDLIDEILELIPNHRKNDVVLVDPSDSNFPVGLNMLDMKEDETMELLADGIISVFKKFFADSWGPRLQYILTNTILTLLHCQNLSLLAVPRILMDNNYRKFLLKQVDDAFLKKYWNEEFAAMATNPKLLNEAISPILNKVGRFLNSTMVRNMMGQVKSTVDLSDVMNTKKIFLVNLSQGKIGEENSSLLGGMLVTRLYSNAMQRAKIPEQERQDFYLYVDEFQNFANDSFMKILSEARKYGLCLTIAHQYIDQIDDDLRNAIFGNIGTILNYVVGNKDAETLSNEYSPYLTKNDLVNLDRYHLSMKMTIDGQQSKPFTAIALKPFYKKMGLQDEIRQISRENFSKPREEVEAKLSKWANSKYDDKGNLIQEKR